MMTNIITTRKRHSEVHLCWALTETVFTTQYIWICVWGGSMISRVLTERQTAVLRFLANGGSDWRILQVSRRASLTTY